MSSRLSPERGTMGGYAPPGAPFSPQADPTTTPRLPDSPPTRSPSDVLVRVLPAALLLIFATQSWLLRAPAMLTRQDDARYLGLARALRMGTYRDFMWPGAPWHHMYPPGFPALLAVWTAIGGESFDWLVTLHITLSVVSLGVMYLAVRRGMSPLIALLSLAVLAVSPQYIDQAGQVGSESALAVCFSLAAWSSITMPRGKAQTSVLIALAMLAPLMRSAGLALPAAVGLCWLSQKRYRDAALLTAIGAVILGALVMWTLADPTPLAGSSYVGDIASAKAAPVGLLATFAQRIAKSLEYYLTRSIPILFAMPTVEGTIVDNMIGASLLSAGLVVGMLRATARLRVTALLLFFTALILLVWPYRQLRFLIPVAPLLVPTVLFGLEWIIVRIRRASATAVLTGISLVLVLSGFAENRAKYLATRECVRGRATPADNCVSPDQASFFHSVAFVRDSLPKEARILSAKSEPLYIYTGHTTLPTALWLGRDSTTIWEGLRRERAEYVMLGALHVASVNYLAPLLASHCHALAVVASFPPNTYLFRTVPPDPANTAACVAIAAYRQRVRPPPE